MGHLIGAPSTFGGGNVSKSSTVYSLVPLNNDWRVQEAVRDGQGFIETIRLHGPYTKKEAEAVITLLNL